MPMLRSHLILRSCLLTAALLVITLSPASVAAQPPVDDFGELLWPPDDFRRFEDLPDLARRLFNDSSGPTVVGIRPLEAVDLNPMNETTTRITLREVGSTNRTIIQRHEPVDAENPSDIVVGVDASDLPSLVEVRPATGNRSTRVLQVTGPPGSLSLSDGEARGSEIGTKDQLRTLANRLGFPSEISVAAGPSDGGGLPWLYHGKRGCYSESVEGHCSTRARFRLDCGNCTLASFVVPAPREEFRNAFSTDPAVHTNLGAGARAVFDGQGRMVAARVSYSFDLNESAIMGPAKAQEEAIDALAGRGYNVTRHLDDGFLETPIAKNRTVVQGVQYAWRFMVREGSSTDQNTSTNPSLATVRQDARSGDILSVETGRLENSTRPDDDGGGEESGPVPNGTPSLGVPAVAVALGVVAAAARHRQ